MQVLRQNTYSPSQSSYIRRKLILYASSYLLVFFLFAATWLAYPGLIYFGRDGNLFAWLAQAQFRWSRPFSVTSLNPFQGVGSMFLPLNPWWDPGSWPLLFNIDPARQHVLSASIYFLELTSSAMILGHALGFPLRYSYAAAMWLAALLFPPFNFLIGLQGWLATAPCYGHSLALVNLMLALFCHLGKPRGAPPLSLACLRWNISMLALIELLFIAFLIPLPMWNGGLLLGYFVFFAMVFASSIDLSTLVWRSLSALVILTLVYFLDLMTFFRAFKTISARFSPSSLQLSSLVSINWSASFSMSGLASARKTLCHWGVVCPRIEWFPPSLIGSDALIGLTIIGAVLAAYRERRPLNVLAAMFATAWSFLFLYWVSLALGILPAGPFAPLYFYLPLYFLLALFSLYPVALGGAAVGRLVAPHLGGIRQKLNLFLGSNTAGQLFTAITPVAAMLAMVLWLSVGETGVALMSGKWRLIRRQQQHLGFAAHLPPRSAIINALEEEVGLTPGSIFRGTVATIFGPRGGPLRSATGLGPEDPTPSDHFEQYLARIHAAYGNSHTLTGLWHFNIPTLDEYGQAVTLPLRLYATEFLAERGDQVDGHFVFARKLNIDVLRALGVRFVLTDGTVSPPDTTLRQTLSRPGAIPLNLYELHGANLATFSPIDLVQTQDLERIVSEIRQKPGQLRVRAFIQAHEPGPLVPVVSSRMRFIRNGVHVEASSKGRSALLLPLQFSHCLTLREKGAPGGPRLIRANILHALLLFEEKVNAEIHWRFDFWRGAACRMADVDDLRRLGM